MDPWNAFCAIMKETCIYYIRAQSLNYIYMHVLLLHLASQLKKEKKKKITTKTLWEIDLTTTYMEKNLDAAGISLFCYPRSICHVKVLSHVS